MLGKLGDGNYGFVFEGQAKLPNGGGGGQHWTRVAIKTTKDISQATERAALLSEMKVLGNLEPNLHLVNLAGTCVARSTLFGTWTDMYLLLEFCDKGNLRKYMLDHHDDFLTGPLEARRLLGFAHDVSTYNSIQVS